MHSSFYYPLIISKPNKTKPPHLDLFVQQEDFSLCRFLFPHESGILYFHRKSKHSLLRKNDSFFFYARKIHHTKQHNIVNKENHKNVLPSRFTNAPFFYFHIGQWSFQSLHTNFFSTHLK